MSNQHNVTRPLAGLTSALIGLCLYYFSVFEHVNISVTLSHIANLDMFHSASIEFTLQVFCVSLATAMSIPPAVSLDSPVKSGYPKMSVSTGVPRITHSFVDDYVDFA